LICVGKYYYVNSDTGETTWERPEAVKDPEQETVTMVIWLPMTMEEFHEKQQAFKEALAKTAGQGVIADHIFIDTEEFMRKPANAREQGDFDRINTAFDRITMAAAARRLLAYRGIDVTVSVKALDEDAAAAIAASLTEADINTELEKAGLPPATVLAAAAVGESEGDSGELPDGFIHAWSNEYERKYFYNVATGDSSWEKPQTAAIYPKLPECWTAVWSHEEQRYYFNSTTGEITWKKPHSSGCPPEEVDDARWRELHQDPRATAADRNLIEQVCGVGLRFRVQRMHEEQVMWFTVLGLALRV